VIEAEIEGIGVLRNPVISWQEGHGEPAPPRIRPWGDAWAGSATACRKPSVAPTWALAQLFCMQ